MKGENAVQEAQLDTLATFENYMESCLRADWAADKRLLLDAAAMDSFDGQAVSPVLVRRTSAAPAPGRSFLMVRLTMSGTLPKVV